MNMLSARSLLESARADHQRGKLADARRKYEALLKVHPRDATLLELLAQVLREAGDGEGAIKYLRSLVTLKPHDAAALGQLAVVLQEHGEESDAIETARKAIALGPASADAYCCLGSVLQMQSQYEEAAAALSRAIELRPHDARAHTALGCILVGQDKNEAAVEAHRRALALDPAYAVAWNNLGGAFRGLKQFDEAIAAHREAVRLAPNFGKAHSNLANLLLITGNFEEGFREWEWRMSLRRRITPFRQPRWSGEPLHGKAILLYPEQGLGDILQFIRFADSIRQLGGTVLVLVQEKLVRLLRHSLPEIIRIVGRIETEHFDYQLPILSVPHRLGANVRMIPGSFPYLVAEPERVRHWAARLPEGKLRIGIAWQGNPKGPDDQNRSIPLLAFEPLGRIPGVTLINLQKGEGTEQLRTLPEGFRVNELGPEFDAGEDAFLDTAAVMMSLDLIVTSDTSIAHLAGALARPTWVALQTFPDWRWQLTREDSPWYPTMRLFRQRTRGDWLSVFEAMAEVLRRAS